jgi:hypothetical protein
MNNQGIKLNMDMADVTVINGTIKSISGGSDDDYVTKIDMTLPAQDYKFPVGIYNDNYDDSPVQIKISLIEKKENDQVCGAAKGLRVGASGSGLESIPFEAFSDNRGVYPAISVAILFNKRIASWIDDNHDTGMKTDLDYEKMRIIGFANEEKIKAITVINRLITSQKWEGIRNLTYDDVTVFVETYFKKPSADPLLLKVNALSSKTAYKTAVYDYIFPKIDEPGAAQPLVKFQASHSDKDISHEKDLLFTVEEAIYEVLKHQVELRRWIEPFWDGERKIKHEGNELLVPRSPKGETKIQPTLHIVLDLALSPLGIHVTRESDEGVGLLDFRFLYTTKDGIPLTVGAEFKLAHHKKIKNGIKNQLPAYLKAIRSSSGIFIVMWFKDGKYFTEPKSYDKDNMEAWILKQAGIVSAEKGITISAVMLDASIRLSASNL